MKMANTSVAKTQAVSLPDPHSTTVPVQRGSEEMVTCVLLSIPAKRCTAAVILRRRYVLTGLQERYKAF